MSQFSMHATGILLSIEWGIDGKTTCSARKESGLLTAFHLRVHNTSRALLSRMIKMLHPDMSTRRTTSPHSDGHPTHTFCMQANMVQRCTTAMHVRFAAMAGLPGQAFSKHCSSYLQLPSDTHCSWKRPCLVTNSCSSGTVRAGRTESPTTSWSPFFHRKRGLDSSCSRLCCIGSCPDVFLATWWWWWWWWWLRKDCVHHNASWPQKGTRMGSYQFKTIYGGQRRSMPQQTHPVRIPFSRRVSNKVCFFTLASIEESRCFSPHIPPRPSYGRARLPSCAPTTAFVALVGFEGRHVRMSLDTLERKVHARAVRRRSPAGALVGCVRRPTRPCAVNVCSSRTSKPKRHLRRWRRT